MNSEVIIYFIGYSLITLQFNQPVNHKKRFNLSMSIYDSKYIFYKHMSFRERERES